VPSETLTILRVEDLAPIAREFSVQAPKAFQCEQIELRDHSGNRIRIVAVDRFTPSVGPVSDPI